MWLNQQFAWRGRTVAWDVLGGESTAKPSVVMCHGTPWSSRLWRPYARALSDRFTVYLWDMPGYGLSSKDPSHPVDLSVQSELFRDLIEHWGLTRPHVVAHDYGGAVSLRAHLLHNVPYSSLALVDVVALRPWGSDFFRLIANNAEIFMAQPNAIHEGALRAYIQGASHRGLTEWQLQALIEPWLTEEGKHAFYRQIAQADERFTDEFYDLLGAVDIPVQVIWGDSDTWIPVDRAHNLAELIPGAELTIVPNAGHLIHYDTPIELATALHRWLDSAANTVT